jgi:hypothetical protein
MSNWEETRADGIIRASKGEIERSIGIGSEKRQSPSKVTSIHPQSTMSMVSTRRRKSVSANQRVGGKPLEKGKKKMQLEPIDLKK